MDISMHRYKYAIRNIEMTLDVNYKFQDTAAVYLTIIHDYLNRRMPIIQFGLQMDTVLIQKAYKYKDKAKIKLDVIEYEYNAENVVINSRMLLQHSFSIVPKHEITYYTTTTDTATEANTNAMATPQGFEMYLVDLDIVNLFNKELSTIFRNTSRPAALQAMFMMREIPTGIVIATPPQNLSNVDNIIIPLDNLVGNINALNKAYGLYNAYPIIYHDLKYLYCINRIEPNVIIPSSTDFNEVVLVLKNSIDETSKIPGAATDIASKSHYVNLQGSPVVEDYSTHVDKTQFATIASVDNNGNVTKTTLNDTSTKINFIYQHNEMTVDQEINEKLRTDMTVTVALADCAASVFTPYKSYTFDIDTQYTTLDLQKKTFRLGSQIINFKKNGTDFTESTTLSLYKI